MKLSLNRGLSLALVALLFGCGGKGATERGPIRLDSGIAGDAPAAMDGAATSADVPTGKDAQAATADATTPADTATASRDTTATIDSPAAIGDTTAKIDSPAAIGDTTAKIDSTSPVADAKSSPADLAEAPADTVVLRQDLAPATADVSPRLDVAPADTRGGPDVPATACDPDAGPATLVHLTPQELKALLATSEDPYLINVKGASIGLIPGTDATLVNDVPGIEALVGQNRCANIVLYCLSGGTSQSVGAQLIAKGYQRVRDLAGGMNAWKALNYPTE
jgi:rhodanese-related sulfurtransferase